MASPTWIFSHFIWESCQARVGIYTILLSVQHLWGEYMPIFILSERTKHGFFFSTPIPLQKSSLATENDHSVPFVTNVGSTLLYRSSQFNRGTVNLFFFPWSLYADKEDIMVSFMCPFQPHGHRPSYIALVSCPFTLYGIICLKFLATLA
jgi:hypothetical protein